MLLNAFFKDKSKWLVAGFFAALLVTGLCILPDYGTYQDQKVLQVSGERFVEYIRNFNILRPAAYKIAFNHDASHGPAFEIALVLIQKLFRLVDPRDVVLMRHLVTFLLFFVSVVFFYRLVRIVFNGRGLALLGCVILVLHPRIFASAFFNTTDIPFLSFYIISTYTLFRFLKKNTIVWAAWHALACALLTDIRSPGAFLAGVTGVVFCFQLFKLRHSSQEFRKALLSCIVFLILFIELTILFSPALWLKLSEHSSRMVLTSVRMVSTGNPFWSPRPWYYNPAWIVGTTPLLFLGLFLIGLVASVRAALSRHLLTAQQRVWIRVILVLLIVPLVAPVLLKTRLFSSWRHHFFVYPMIVMVALVGVKACIDQIDLRLKGQGLLVARRGFFFFIGICLIFTVRSMVIYHPYQHVYFNALQTMSLKKVPWARWLQPVRKLLWARDDQELYVHEALLKILEKDKRPVIRVNVNAYFAALIPREERKRLKFIDVLGFDYSGSSGDFEKINGLISAIMKDQGKPVPVIRSSQKGLQWLRLSGEPFRALCGQIKNKNAAVFEGFDDHQLWCIETFCRYPEGYQAPVLRLEEFVRLRPFILQKMYPQFLNYQEGDYVIDIDKKIRYRSAWHFQEFYAVVVNGRKIGVVYKRMKPLPGRE